LFCQEWGVKGVKTRARAGAAPQGAAPHQHGAARDGSRHWGALRARRCDTGGALGGRTGAGTPRQLRSPPRPQPGPPHPAGGSVRGPGQGGSAAGSPSTARPCAGRGGGCRLGLGTPGTPLARAHAGPTSFGPRPRVGAVTGSPRTPWRHSERRRARKPAEPRGPCPLPAARSLAQTPEPGEAPTDALKTPPLQPRCRWAGPRSWSLRVPARCLSFPRLAAPHPAQPGQPKPTPGRWPRGWQGASPPQSGLLSRNSPEIPPTRCSAAALPSSKPGAGALALL